MLDLRAYAGSMTRDRMKTIGIGALALVVIVVALAFALGGGSDDQKRADTSLGVAKPLPAAQPVVAPRSAHRANTNAPLAAAPEVAGQNSLSFSNSAAGTAGTASSAGSTPTVGGSVAAGAPTQVIDDSASASGVDATRIVKTGELQLRVAKGSVQSTMSKLSALASGHGGYVAESNTDTNPTSPSGDITLRIPVGQFAAVVTEAEKYGHVESLSTEAKDVTGKYVDLNARMHALQRTRSTYLSILSRATTIGATLSVQQRIDDVQQQIDQLHGAIKLLASQSAYSTLTVRVDQPTPIAVTNVHHGRHGINKAWHTSLHRFNRGIDAIVAAVGPILLAVLLIAAGYAVIRLGSRGYRRNRSSGAAS